MSQGWALVTGSCVRTGKAIAQRLAREGLGVWIHGKPQAFAAAQATRADCEALGVRARVALADLSTPSGCEELARQIDTPLRALVHNVGIYRPASLLDTGIEDWTETMRTNLDAPFWLTRLLVDRMERGSSIVALGYVGTGRLAGTARTAAYSASKVGLLSLIKSWALELGPRGIRSNMVSPGQLENSVDLPEDITRRVPLGRSGTEQDVADAVAWLCSDQASYITGQELEVAGGLMLSLKGQ